MPSSARWLLALVGILICLASVLFWQRIGSGLMPQPVSTAENQWLSAAGLRYFWLPFLSGAGLVLAVCLAGRSGG